ncbi:MAG: TonB-dependent receptor, partial [Spongiibacteraceae bacterium]|nr:TonB-dependent receptor [Spongiibacteraceae bacterium]
QCDIAGSSSLKREVDSYYAELLVPIVGSSNRIPGIESLQLKAAVRHDKYSDVGNTTNPQFGIDWQPIESLRVRASYGESFRAPLITDLYGNSSAMFVELFPDPELGGAPRVGVFQSGGNLDLEPATATTKTLGFDWQPEQLPGASLSLTWFDIEYEKQIAAYLGDNNILNREDAFAGAGIILRDAAAAARVDELFAQGLTVARGVLPAQVTLFVDGRPNNLGVSRMKGLDFLLSYGWESTAGSWLFSLNGMYVDHYEVALTAAGAMEDRRNTIFHPNRIRMRASLAWERNNYGARVVFNHIGSYTNNLVEPSETVESYQPVDLSAWIDLGRDERGWAGGWLLSMELRNAFDEDPPYVNIAPTNNGSGGYDAAAASPIGRVLSMSISKSF